MLFKEKTRILQLWTDSCFDLREIFPNDEGKLTLNVFFHFTFLLSSKNQLHFNSDSRNAITVLQGFEYLVAINSTSTSNRNPHYSANGFTDPTQTVSTSPFHFEYISETQAPV